VVGGVSPHEPSFEFEPTVFWDGLTKTFKEGVRRPDGAAVEDQAPIDEQVLIRHAELSQGRALWRAALSAWLCEREAERAGLAVDPATWRSTAARFRRERGLLAAADLARWMRRHAVSEAEFGRLVQREALVEQLGRRHAEEVRRRVLDVLRERGELGRVREDVQRREQLVQTGGASSPLSEAELITWFTKKAGPFDAAGPLWQHIGFPDAETFRQELLILHALERKTV
jgi:hypothetical protein